MTTDTLTAFTPEQIDDQIGVINGLAKTFAALPGRPEFRIAKSSLIWLIKVFEVYTPDRRVRIQMLRRIFPYGLHDFRVSSTRDLSYAQGMALHRALTELPRVLTRSLYDTEPTLRMQAFLTGLAALATDDIAISEKEITHGRRNKD